MTSYTPAYKVRINGVDYTSESINQVLITVGRNEIFEPTLPGYCIIEILNLTGTSPTIGIYDSINITTTDSSNTEIDLFTGEVTSVNNQIIGAGAVGLANSLTITGVGALARLVRKNAGANAYPQELDGERIERILQDALFTAWEDVTSTISWDEIDASLAWEDYGIQGIDIIDNGRYEIIARAGELENANELVRATEISGLGYLYETTDGLIGYADADRRTANIANNSIALDADFLNAQLRTRLSTQDVINSITIRYDNGASEVSAVKEQSVDTYGLIQSGFETLLVETADAIEQAARYVALRSNPSMNLESISLNLVNDNIDNSTRDALLDISMDTLLVISGLPQAIVSTGAFEGYIEGWTWTLTKRSLQLEMQVSNAIYSAQEVQWQQYNPTTQWQNLANDLQWLDLTIG
jgi:hypothetical protein